MKKQKFKHSEQQPFDTCIRQLEGLLEGLKAGTLSLYQEGQKVWLRPGGAMDVELRAEQSGDRETLEIKLGWQRGSLHVVSRRAEDAPPKTVRNWQQRLHEGEDPSDAQNDGVEPAPGNQPPRSLDAEAVRLCQEIYSAARRPSREGQHRLDEARFVRALAEAGIEPTAREELYNVALRAEADGRASLFAEDVIAALRKAS